MEQPRHLFLYGMITSFFGASRDVLDTVLTALGGYEPLATDAEGRPAPPDHVVSNFAKLPPHKRFDYVGASFVATSSLGYAYVYSFKLLYLLETGRDDPLKGSSRDHLAKLYDALPATVRNELSDLYNGVGSQDFEMEIRLGGTRRKDEDPHSSGRLNLRQQLHQWQSRGMLQDSHRKLADTADASVVRLLIPLRAMLLLDRILANKIAPRLGIAYTPMDAQMSNRTEGPTLKWDGTTVSVSLPDKRGRILDASWVPTITSVVRIRESDVDEWSPGFETPFNRCTFVGLKPDTEYDVQVTHKNSSGEGKPAFSKVTTKADGQ